MSRPGNFFGNFKDFALAFSGISYCLITDGTEPDEYEDVNYEDMDHDEFINYIRISLETGKELPDVIGE